MLAVALAATAFSPDHAFAWIDLAAAAVCLMYHVRGWRSAREAAGAG